MGTTTRILTACAAAAALFNAPLARAASDVPRKSAAASVPTTVAEHEALAKTYEDKVVLYQKEAQFHREMLADMQKKHPMTTKSGVN